jgi:hypothetical protein
MRAMGFAMPPSAILHPSSWSILVFGPPFQRIGLQLVAANFKLPTTTNLSYGRIVEADQPLQVPFF